MGNPEVSDGVHFNSFNSFQSAGCRFCQSMLSSRRKYFLTVFDFAESPILHRSARSVRIGTDHFADRAWVDTLCDL